MIPLKINNKNLWEIMDPSDTNNFRSLATEEEKIALAIKLFSILNMHNDIPIQIAMAI